MRQQCRVFSLMLGIKEVFNCTTSGGLEVEASRDETPTRQAEDVSVGGAGCRGRGQERPIQIQSEAGSELMGV